MTTTVLPEAHSPHDAPNVAPPGARRPARVRRVPVSLALSVAVVVLVVAWALLPDVFAHQDPVTGVPAQKFLPPGAAHWFGTDHLGRDVYSRIVHGTASSVLSALVAVGIGVVVGGVLGLVAGFVGGWVDAVVGRTVDVLLAVPGFLLAVVVVSALGFQTINAAVATGVSAVAVFARVMRAEVLKVRRATFVEASTLAGGSSLHVLVRHVLPNAYRSVLALSVLQLGVSILVIAGLAFLGYGDPPPASDWGLLVASGKNYPLAPWLVLAPAAVIVVVVLSVNRVSRRLRQA
ncbi:ABC transporter permease [Luteimicrobium subarcticum]|uniref:Peptide/nickel transport system permease protein n=1 Tax=Luteimicrobium subarcticum TaxID=620910 RepID=A0A2M8WRW0_9MICO|nr:ABC transporter permease [Luteimicrobium subarcticum]PJI93680.1 peptide/nickel transport system permease protein [Luteimicrobium subarcticum]